MKKHPKPLFGNTIFTPSKEQIASRKLVIASARRMVGAGMLPQLNK